MAAKAAIVYVILLALLAGPVYPLYHLSQLETTASTLAMTMLLQVGFTTLFAFCLRFFTCAERHELFVSAATSVITTYPPFPSPRYLEN